jgi:hypothetical protein
MAVDEVCRGRGRCPLATLTSVPFLRNGILLASAGWDTGKWAAGRRSRRNLQFVTHGFHAVQGCGSLAHGILRTLTSDRSAQSDDSVRGQDFDAQKHIIGVLAGGSGRSSGERDSYLLREAALG